MRWAIVGLLAATLWASAPCAARGDEKHEINLGKHRLTAAEGWERREPSSRIVAHEFAAKAVEGDETDGRLTVMSAGGTVEANIERWLGQFSRPDGKPPREAAKIEKREIAGLEVHTVDIEGTYRDQRGPQAPAVERPDYRMLAAIIVTPEANFFVKFYGPRKTIGENAKAFEAMLSGLELR